MTDRELIEKHCKEECLFKGDCCSSCSLSKLRNINYGIFLVDHNKQEYNIDSEIDYTKKYTHLHINPEILSIFDYYVKINDLVNLSKAREYVWSEKDIDLKTNISDIDGKYLTSLMVNSPAADYVRELGGFIGSMVQMDYLLKNHEKIDRILEKLGYNSYYSSTYLWSSSQYDAFYAWFWNSGGYWNANPKTNSFLVVPLFSFSSL